MKIKRILQLGTLSLAGFAFAACSFLDTDPKIIGDKGYYSNEQKILYGLAGVYGVINSEELYGSYYSLQISNADDLCYFNNYTNGETRPDKYNHNAGTDVVYQSWRKLYEGIKNANRFMEAMKTVQIAPEELTTSIESYTAEARFLRAYYHFLLAQAWGDVPLRTEATVSPDPADVQLAATPQEQVLKWCADEIEGIVTLLSDDVNLQPSRVTQTVAEGILARIYLFMAGETVKTVEGLDKRDMYGRAAYWAGEVISSHTHNLNNDYRQVFINMITDKYDVEYRESMWEAEFLGDRSTASLWSNGRIGDLIGLKSQSGANNYGEWACNYSYGFYNGSYRLWQLYWEADRTADEASDNGQITDVRQEWNLPPYNFVGANDRKITYKKSSSEQTVTEIFTQPQSMYRTPYFYNNNFTLPEIEGQDLSVENPFEASCIIYDPTVMAAVRNVGKWRRETIYEKQMTAKQLYTTINFPILRFSDVLLMYAEASNEYEGSPNDLAKEGLRRVRNRAGIKTDESRLGDYRSFRDLVRNERARELAFEGLRKWDLIRWGIFVDEMQAAGQEIPTESKYKNATIVEYAARNYAAVTGKHIYLPVPTKELAVNLALKQNPLW